MVWPLLRRLFGRRRRPDLTDPLAFMNRITELQREVKRAMDSADPVLKQRVAARLDGVIEHCRQLALMGDTAYAPLGRTTFVRVDVSTSRQLASRMLPLLETMRGEVGARTGSRK